MSIVQRTNTFAAFNSQMSDVSSLMTSMYKTQQQISSGVKAQNFQGLDGSVEQFTALKTRIAKAEAFKDNNTVAIAKFQQINQSLTNMTDLVDDMEDIMTLRRNGATGQNVNLSQQLSNMLQSMAGELNSTYGGRYLFGGTETAKPPVIDNPIPNPLEQGVPDTQYYQGSSENISLRAADNVTLAYDVRADDPAFQKVIAAVKLALEGDVANDDEKLAAALDLLQAGQKELTAVQARVNVTVVNLQDINQRHDSMRLYWKGVTEELSKTDIVEASTKLANDQAVLQASFQAFARISQLHLMDYL